MIQRAILLGLLVTLFAGCDSPPPRETIKANIEKHLQKKRIGLSFLDSEDYDKLADSGALQKHVKSYEIVNHYTKRIDDEKWFIYDVKAVVTAPDGQYDVRIRMGFIKRGKEWYFRETDD